MPTFLINTINSTVNAMRNGLLNVRERCSTVKASIVSLYEIDFAVHCNTEQQDRYHDSICKLRDTNKILQPLQLERDICHGYFLNTMQQQWRSTAFKLNVHQLHFNDNTEDCTKTTKEYWMAWHLLPQDYNAHAMYEMFVSAMNEISHTYITPEAECDSIPVCKRFQDMYTLLVSVIHGRCAIIDTLLHHTTQHYAYLNETLQLLFAIHAVTQEQTSKVNLDSLYYTYMQSALHWYQEVKQPIVVSMSIMQLEKLLQDNNPICSEVLHTMQIFLATVSQLELQHILQQAFNNNSCHCVDVVLQGSWKHGLHNDDSVSLPYALVYTRMTHAIQIYCMHTILHLYNVYMLRSKHKTHKESTQKWSQILLNSIRYSDTLACNITSHLVVNLQANVIIYVVNNLEDSTEEACIQEVFQQLENDTVVRRTMVANTLNCVLHNKTANIIYSILSPHIDCSRRAIHKIMGNLFNNNNNDVTLKQYLYNQLNSLLLHVRNDLYLKNNIQAFIYAIRLAHNEQTLVERVPYAYNAMSELEFIENIDDYIRVAAHNEHIAIIAQNLLYHYSPIKADQLLSSVSILTQNKAMRNVIDIFTKLQIPQIGFNSHKIHVLLTATKRIMCIARNKLVAQAITCSRNILLPTLRGLVYTATALWARSMYYYFTCE